MNKLCIRDPQKVRMQRCGSSAWNDHAFLDAPCLRTFWGITLRGGEDLDAWRCCRLLMWNNHMALPASSPAPKSSPPNAQLIH